MYMCGDVIEINDNDLYVLVVKMSIIMIVNSFVKKTCYSNIYNYTFDLLKAFG